MEFTESELALPDLGSAREPSTIADKQQASNPLVETTDASRGDGNDCTPQPSQNTFKHKAHLVADGELLDIQAVAIMVGVSTRSIWRLSDAGKMPAPVKLGRIVRWSRKKLTQWIDDDCPTTRAMRYRK